MESTGEGLKKVRLSKGLTLEEVHKKTKIHLNILKAIEGEGLTDLNPVYLKGFLKIYCKFLGLDPKDYIKDYIPDYREQVVVKYVEPLDKPQKPLSFLKSISLRLVFLKPPKKIRKTLVFGVAALILVLGLFNLGKFIASKRQAHLAKVVLPAKAESKKAQTLKKQAVSGIKLIVRSRENCWLSVKVDGRLLFQRVLEKGRFETWTAKDKIELSVGNASALELEVNGQIFKNLGKRGQKIKNILITKEGLSTSS